MLSDARAGFSKRSRGAVGTGGMGAALRRENPTERSLIVAARAGDQDALEELARSCWPQLRRAALVVVGDPVSAEDVAQEALVRFVRNLDRCDPDRPLGPWLRTIARNVARDELSRRGRRNEHALTELEAVQPRFEQALDLDRGARRALEAYGRLTPRQREIFELCDRQGFTPSQAAVELEVAPGTARALLHQARSALRRLLAGETAELIDLLRDP